MNNFIKSTFLILIGILLLACEEEVTPPQIEDAEDKVVVNGLIAPSFEQINVQVSKSRNAFGVIEFDDSDIIQDAIVAISNGTEERNLTFDASSQVYTLPTTNFPIAVSYTHLTLPTTPYV